MLRNFFRREPSADASITELAQFLYRDALAFFSELEKEVGACYSSDQEDRRRKANQVFLETIYFWLHLSNRAGFQLLDDDLSRRLQKKLFPLVMDLAISHLYAGENPINLQIQKNDFISELNRAEVQYAQCKTLFPKRGDRSLFKKETTGGSQISLIGEFADNLASAYKGSRCLSTNAVFNFRIVWYMDAFLKGSQLDALIRKCGDALGTS